MEPGEKIRCGPMSVGCTSLDLQAMCTEYCVTPLVQRFINESLDDGRVGEDAGVETGEMVGMVCVASCSIRASSLV